MKTCFSIVLVRHGSTQWNLDNRFTGWSDIPLSETGFEEAKQAGKQLAANNLQFDEAHVSVLERTKQALMSMLQTADHPEIPVFSSWRLNERHYGALQGLNKQEIFSIYGETQSFNWWRGYQTSPPPLGEDDPRHPRFSSLYRDLPASALPDSESLAQCRERLIPYWDEILRPAVQSGKRLIVVSHGNTLRSLRMHVENISPEAIQKVEIPLGIPFLIHFDQNMEFERIEWLR